jgi:hypothetical protein
MPGDRPVMGALAEGDLLIDTVEVARHGRREVHPPLRTGGRYAWWATGPVTLSARDARVLLEALTELQPGDVANRARLADPDLPACKAVLERFLRVPLEAGETITVEAA